MCGLNTWWDSIGETKFSFVSSCLLEATSWWGMGDALGSHLVWTWVSPVWKGIVSSLSSSPLVIFLHSSLSPGEGFDGDIQFRIKLIFFSSFFFLLFYGIGILSLWLILLWFFLLKVLFAFFSFFWDMISLCSYDYLIWNSVCKPRWFWTHKDPLASHCWD